ncbi:hypothetical protein CRI94_02100 [Longibacter salinarum]|uniref:Uncharacterized protein n=1 Tax=Longibacter salinarum TaxID=1850348 RepID=A0A2A8D2A4_9BACT|nr:hypothetical protein [Longibacter salinarum]PEN15102.1 hypothetical protein CRI94_02100 [Longibacter salinarum]
MQLTRNVALAAALSAVLHLALGWEWTLVPAVLVGVLSAGRGWLAGLLTVLLPWAGILAWSYSVAPGSTPILLDVLGGLIGGNTPGAAVVALTLLFGALLGFAGGAVGGQLRGLFGIESAPERRHPASA